MRRPSNVREPCKHAIWDERWRSDTDSLVDPVFRTAAECLPQLATRPESNLDHRASWCSAFGQVEIPCRMVVCLLHRDCFVHATRFDSVLVGKDPLIWNSVVRKRASVDHLNHSGSRRSRVKPKPIPKPLWRVLEIPHYARTAVDMFSKDAFFCLFCLFIPLLYCSDRTSLCRHLAVQ